MSVPYLVLAVVTLLSTVPSLIFSAAELKHRPQDHLGGALYLFVRGMGSAPGAGVFAWHPPAALIEALSRLLSGEVVG